MERQCLERLSKFLRLIKSSVDGDKQAHLICDNYATHKHAKVQAWAAKNPRLFRDLSEKALRRGSFHNVDDLIGAIDEYIHQHNQNPKPFIWTASARDILAKVKRARRALDKV